jgi:hypothetical protein
MIWLGFAVFGWASLLIWLSTPQQTVGFSGPPVVGYSGPPLPLITWGLLDLVPYINQTSTLGGEPLIAYDQICHSLEVILVSFVGAVLGRFVAVEDDRPNPLRA